MGLLHHLWGASVRIYSYIYDLLGLGALVNITFRTVVSSSGPVTWGMLTPLIRAATSAVAL